MLSAEHSSIVDENIDMSILVPFDTPDDVLKLSYKLRDRFSIA